MTCADSRDTGLLVLRVTLGGVLVAHGVQKLFGWLGGGGLDGTAGAMDQMGFRPGRQSALAAGLGEAGSGALLVLGAATPAAGAAGLGTMTAAAAVHAPNGFFAAGGGLEYPVLLGAASGALALTGAGRYSLDHLLGHRLDRPGTGIAAVAVAAAVSGVVLARRRRALHAEAAEIEARAADVDVLP
ncbi:DoxX family protein [Peterkaempfera bronchialis]|uniref:DoxX family protein n=1 Tax=Peterkaempfera bronchialis TaxID=2126346 RepID=A0A345ST77_9ACTN|nr:DoxX family protein [Peterkaempfera bronchialis]AXI76932.1 DoxX family protein [Peterkaempfera bronchialis]